jgi:hypothetical protein
VWKLTLKPALLAAALGSGCLMWQGNALWFVRSQRLAASVYSRAHMAGLQHINSRCRRSHAWFFCCLAGQGLVRELHGQLSARCSFGSARRLCPTPAALIVSHDSGGLLRVSFISLCIERRTGPTAAPRLTAEVQGLGMGQAALGRPLSHSPRPAAVC